MVNLAFHSQFFVASLENAGVLRRERSPGTRARGKCPDSQRGSCSRPESSCSWAAAAGQLALRHLQGAAGAGSWHYNKSNTSAIRPQLQPGADGDMQLQLPPLQLLFFGSV